jgi:hypothetical protein
MSEKSEQVIGLCDGQRSSVEIAKLVGLSPRYVRKIATTHNLDRLSCGAQKGEKNHQFVSGRRVDSDGYVSVSVPLEYPGARVLPGKQTGFVFEHRIILERKIGRYLLPSETVDHIDGLTLHNSPDNLRFFQNNGDHLQATITGIPKRTSKSGILNIRTSFDQRATMQRVDTYRRRRERGDVRLRQILLAALSLGINSPYLLGTHRHLEKAQIDWSSRSNLGLALAELNRRWEVDLLL